MKKYDNFLSENFQFLGMKYFIYLNRRIFVMKLHFCHVMSLKETEIPFLFCSVSMFPTFMNCICFRT